MSILRRNQFCNGPKSANKLAKIQIAKRVILERNNKKEEPVVTLRAVTSDPSSRQIVLSSQVSVQNSISDMGFKPNHTCILSPFEKVSSFYKTQNFSDHNSLHKSCGNNEELFVQVSIPSKISTQVSKKVSPKSE